MRPLVGVELQRSSVYGVRTSYWNRFDRGHAILVPGRRRTRIVRRNAWERSPPPTLFGGWPVLQRSCQIATFGTEMFA